MKVFEKKLKQVIKTILPEKLLFILQITRNKIKLLTTPKRVGKNSYIDKTVSIYGWNHIKVGNNTIIGESSWLNVNCRVKDCFHLTFGDYCYIGRRNLFSSGRELKICDFVMISNDCKFLGNNHVFSNPLQPYISTGSTSEEIMVIGINVWIGAGVTVLGNVKIGHGSIIGAGSVVTKDIPPFSIAVGNPCKVIKRYNFKEFCWQNIEGYQKDSELDQLIPKENDYLAKLKENSKTLEMPIYAATSRFGDLP